MDVAYIDIELTDDKEILSPLFETELTIEIQGEATITGTGTSTPRSAISYLHFTEIK